MCDQLVRLMLRPETIARRLVAALDLHAGMRVLDLGCGTGSVTLAIARAHTDVEVVGIDVDERALGIARDRAVSEGLRAQFSSGRPEAPPFEPASFDRVVASLVLHHLFVPDMRAALAAAFGLLRPGGELHVADWTEPDGRLMRAAFLPARLLEGFAATDDARHGQVAARIREAGFTHVREHHTERTVLGSLGFFRALR